MLSEQAGDNPSHLAFERPPREYARGKGEGRSGKSSLEWNLTKFQPLWKRLGQQPCKSFFLVVRCWNILLGLKDAKRFPKQMRIYTLQDSARSTTWKQEMFLTLGWECISPWRLRYSQPLPWRGEAPLEKSQQRLRHPNCGDANLESTNSAISRKSYRYIIANDKFKLDWREEKTPIEQVRNTLFQLPLLSSRTRA